MAPNSIIEIGCGGRCGGGGVRLLEKQQIFGCAVVDRTGCAHLIRVFAAPTPLILPKKGRKPQVVCVVVGRTGLRRRRCCCNCSLPRCIEGCVYIEEQRWRIASGRDSPPLITKESIVTRFSVSLSLFMHLS